MSLERTVENVYLRQDASQLVRKYFWPLLGMTLLTQIITNGLDRLLTMLGDVITAPETDAVVSSITQYASSSTLTTAAPVLDAVTRLFTSPAYLLFNLAYLLITAMVSQTLLLGSTAEYIRAGYGLTPQVRGIFSRMHSCLKALGLHLMICLKTILWMLPGLTLIFADVTIMQGASSPFLVLTGIGLLFALTIPAILRYAMAVPILADAPDRGIRECITLSKGMMQGRKWQYFKLMALPLAVMLLILAVVSTVLTTVLATAMVNYPSAASTIATAISFLTTLYWQLQLDLLPALFYLKRIKKAPDAPVSYWLQEHPSTGIEGSSLKEAPADSSQETTEEKENPHEQPDC